MGLFLQVLLKLKHKKPTFQALFALIILSSMVDLLFVPLIFLSQFSEIFDYLQLVVLCYSFLVFLFAFAKSNEVGLGFSLLTISLSTVVLIVLMTIINVIFIITGLMPPPIPPV